MNNDPLFPSGMGLSPDSGLRRRDHGKGLLGGSPIRILRLSKAGSKQVTEWFAGAPIGPGTAATKLARKLLDNGMAHPVPLSYLKQPAASDFVDPEITIVIPVKDDLKGLIATLGSLRNESRNQSLPSTRSRSLSVIVVDDGSSTPISTRELDTPDNVQIIRNDISGGPGSARNRGFENVSTEFVAFVDAGVTLSLFDLHQLAQHLADPVVTAVAPRVQSDLVESRAASGRTARNRADPGAFPTSQSIAIARYERCYSPLDLGQQPGPVKPGSRLSYVPSACLVVRSTTLQTMGEASFVFDPRLRYGEDVDLEWRLIDEGTIRYDPSIVVSHPPRSDVFAFVRQRIGYGSAAAALAERHGNTVAPFRSSPWGMAVLVLMLAKHPVPGFLLATRSAVLTSQKLRGRLPDHQVEAIRLSTIGHLTSGIALGQTAIRSWWPAALVGLAVPFARPSVCRLISWGLVAKIWRHRQDENKIVQMAIGLLDDLSYGFGLWQGAWSERSFRSLLPDLDPIALDKSS